MREDSFRFLRGTCPFVFTRTFLIGHALPERPASWLWRGIICTWKILAVLRQWQTGFISSIKWTLMKPLIGQHLAPPYCTDAAQHEVAETRHGFSPLYRNLLQQNNGKLFYNPQNGKAYFTIKRQLANRIGLIKQLLRETSPHAQEKKWSRKRDGHKRRLYNLFDRS